MLSDFGTGVNTQKPFKKIMDLHVIKTVGSGKINEYLNKAY